jgi:hypothetical protein
MEKGMLCSWGGGGEERKEGGRLTRIYPGSWSITSIHLLSTHTVYPNRAFTCFMSVWDVLFKQKIGFAENALLLCMF